jgi:hypothetical protein
MFPITSCETEKRLFTINVNNNNKIQSTMLEWKLNNFCILSVESDIKNDCHTKKRSKSMQPKI